MRFYHSIFCVLFFFLERIEGGFTYQTAGNRAFEASLIISFIQFINVLTFIPVVDRSLKYIILLAILTLINYLIFCYKSKFTIIVKSYSTLPVTFKVIAVVYLQVKTR